MNGYLQCLIDQYQVKVRKATGPVERNIYRDVLNDLLKFQRYIEEPEEEPNIEDIVPRKYAVADFSGDINGFVDYLKRLKEDI
ncbi:hypothetical protein [Clostridium sp. HV4-5-A1G]|uniref:hypothetical protein n=1 Tax=Clostridium sp. HV4-5-A1G TaxID=2004595 RepID=UPI00123BD366|nr:hypothetical protein [Clostridium sp. HV4-5-A1G]KAA8676171.1 hypothetical protein F3O63_03605 [Clostridium sp. HV4-5-A1G]